jgi:hypothetical protein
VKEVLRRPRLFDVDVDDGQRVQRRRLRVPRQVGELQHLRVREQHEKHVQLLRSVIQDDVALEFLWVFSMVVAVVSCAAEECMNKSRLMEDLLVECAYESFHCQQIDRGGSGGSGGDDNQGRRGK